ncbi:MAG: FAD-binding oxidoreductase [Chloroflexi bacterium]|nr:MAG: FAD-binding oxidoreductase [Chloroflexota bacterium]
MRTGATSANRQGRSAGASYPSKLLILNSPDAVVIGGGVIGCSIAYHLARRGAGVVVIERETLGSQSTGRCAGGVRRQFSSGPNVAMQQLSVRLLAGLEAETGVDPEFRHIGYLFLLTDERDAEDFKRLIPMWHEHGLNDARWVDPAEVRELAPLVTGDDILGATFCPSDGIASPHAVTSAYAGAGRRLGVKFMEGVAATAIVRDGARIAGVKTTDGDFATPHVFDCAGAWSREIGAMAGVEVPVDPYPPRRRRDALRNGQEGRDAELQHRGRLDGSRLDGRGDRAPRPAPGHRRDSDRLGRPLRGHARPPADTWAGRRRRGLLVRVRVLGSRLPAGTRGRAPAGAVVRRRDTRGAAGHLRAAPLLDRYRRAGTQRGLTEEISR